MSYAHLISNKASRQQVFDESGKPKENKKYIRLSEQPDNHNFVVNPLQVHFKQ